MANVNSLIKFISELDPEKNMARRTLYNYLTLNNIKPTQISPKYIHKFLCFTQNYEHWRKNLAILKNETTLLIQKFFKMDTLTAEWEESLDPQFLYVKKVSDLELFFQDLFISETQSENKIIPLEEGKILTLRFSEENLKLNIFSSVLEFLNGKLIPTPPITDLYYNSNLVLSANLVQKVQLTPTSFCQFILNKDGEVGTGWIHRGYSLNQQTKVNFHKIHEILDLFNSVKKLEYLFINTQTDPDYIYLVKLLEKACQSIENEDPEWESLAKNTLQKTKFALESYFPKDRQLTLLLSQLELAVIRKYQNPSYELQF